MLARTPPRSPPILGRLRHAVGSALRAVASAADPFDPFQIQRRFETLESGALGRRLRNWMPSRSNLNTLMMTSGRTTLARSRYLIRNNPYAIGATECFTSNLVGAGIVPSWDLAEAVKAPLQQSFTNWGDNADHENVTDFYGLQRRVARELFAAGECFVRRRPQALSDLAIYGDERAGDPATAIPLKLQLLPAEQLPIERNLALQNGHRVRQGIEFDEDGRRVAYHFWKAHPGDVTQSENLGQIVIIQASEVLHIHDPLEPGQIRGFPRLTPAIVALWTLDAYDDAEMERKKTAALFSIFVRRPDEDGTFFNIEAEKKAQQGDGIADITMEPGSATVLMPGEDISIAAPADVGQQYEAFQYRTLTRVCAGLGLPYGDVTGDRVKANYGNQRAALLDTRRRLEPVQFGVLVHQFCRPVIGWFLDAAVLAGAIDLASYTKAPGDYRRITWMPPKWDWVDPLKDVQAEIQAINAGLKPRSAVVEAMGYDPVENDRRIKADKDRQDELDLVFGPPAPVVQEPESTGVTDGPAKEMRAVLEASRPVVNVTMPAMEKRQTKTVTKTTVTKHDPDGRIMEFERREVEDA